MGLNFYYSADTKEELETEIERVRNYRGNDNIYNQACFSGYHYAYDTKKNYFYLGFHFLPGRIEKIVENYNQTLTGIKIFIDYKLSIIPIKDRWDSKYLAKDKIPEGFEIDTNNPEKEFVVFHLEFNEKYSDFAKYYLTVIVSQLVRFYASCRDYRSLRPAGDETNLEFTLKEAVNLSNKTIGKYGSWTSVATPYEDFLFINDIDLMNQLLVDGAVVQYPNQYSYAGVSTFTLSWKSMPKGTGFTVLVGNFSKLLILNQEKELLPVPEKKPRKPRVKKVKENNE